MKLFFFNPNDSDYQYFVMAASKKDAHANLIAKLTQLKAGSAKPFIDEDLLKWKSPPFNSNGYPDKYTCEEYAAGEVILDHS